MDYYDVAQVCLSGHMTNSSTQAYPSHNQDYCEKCGEKTITTCQKCDKGIQGYYHVDGVVGLFETPTPAFCKYSGTAFPWTERRINAAVAMSVESDELDESEVQTLEQSLNAMAKDSPEAKLGVVRFNKLMKKLPVEVANFVRDIAVEIAAESVAKTLSGGTK